MGKVMLATCVTWSKPINTADNRDSSRILVLYYAATVLFVMLDFALDFNIRIAFLESLPAARIAYYGVCFTCLGLMLWRPDWTVLISAFESLVTVSALIISMGVRTMLVTEQVLEGGTGFITMPEVYNFMISGGVAYVAWFQGVSRLKNKYRR
ncbi:MAG: hypothetical protein GY785_03360 [Gammaproteobacteria bacterium]|nr:hypothetical protein [Gammaproteobacteria bacterium]